MPDLIVAGPTCRIFQQFLAERVRDAINRCLLAARHRWGSERLDAMRRFACQVYDGVNPADMSMLPHEPSESDYPSPLLELRLKVRGDDGQFFVEQHMGVPMYRKPRANGIGVYCGSGPKFLVDIKMGSLFIECPASNYLGHAGFLHSIDNAHLEEAQEALGLLLASLGVQLQEGVRSGPCSLRLAADGHVRFKGGALLINFYRRRIPFPNLRDPDKRLRLPARRRTFQKTLQEQAYSDIVAVAAALGMCPAISIVVHGFSSNPRRMPGDVVGIYQMHSCRCGYHGKWLRCFPEP